MAVITATELSEFFHSYGICVEEDTVEDWINDTNLVIEAPVGEELANTFMDWLNYKGTSEEPGIDDKTKIERLTRENRVLKKELEDLKEKMFKLATDPDYLPF